MMGAVPAPAVDGVVAKKEMNFFVLRSTFRNIGFAEVTLVRENSKNFWFSSHLFVTLPSKMAKLLRLGKKRNEFLCFALDFS